MTNPFQFLLSPNRPDFTEDPALKAIGDRHFPSDLGYTRRFCTWDDWLNSDSRHPALGAYCRPDIKVIQAPPVVDSDSLFVFLHECGHGRLHPDHDPRPLYVIEWEADEYAFRAMHEAGIEPTHRILVNSALSTERYIKLAAVRGQVRRIADLDPRVRHWAENKCRWTFEPAALAA